MKRIKVLLIEDNPGDVLLTSEALSESKFLVDLEVVNNGREGVDYLFSRGEFIDKTKPDVVLLDINLPLKTGHEVLMEVKDNSITKDIPIIMLTTSSVQDDILKSYQEQASCYIVKPVEVEQFDDFIKVFDRFCDTIDV
ncbi:MAG: response regulator [Algoriphagus aquaeductus]|jgi:CheY-like chemotaxis protein|uniref:Response regulator receiver domain-containing protein n=1 Tax=Algoriphagus aquaeductus TaxID=475299 RepID=A0A326RY75_9BACT|nr:MULTISPECIES: response regulator [Algoriphagus]PZV87505.1 response regulator receiver domain-containing protein [Algoriphagus aquaeductus]